MTSFSSSSSYWQTAQDLTNDGHAFVAVTLIAGRGHVPQDIGAKALITVDGLRHGTVGGGKVEARAILWAREFLAKSKDSFARPDRSPEDRHPKIVTWNLTTDVGMTCGGEVTLLFEIHRPRGWKIALFGAGHVGQALTRTLENLDCHVTCLDTRREWIDRLPDSRKISKIVTDDLPGAVASLGVDTFFVVMTQGHATDLPILEKIFREFPEAPYVGVMGSDVKARKIRHDLLERGIKESLVDRLHSPIGLRLGGNQPFEIAMSVTAELLQCRDA